MQSEAYRIENKVRIYDGQTLVDALEPAPQVVLPSVPTSVRDSFLVQMENGRFRKELVKDDAALAIVERSKSVWRRVLLPVRSRKFVRESKRIVLRTSLSSPACTGPFCSNPNRSFRLPTTHLGGDR